MPRTDKPMRKREIDAIEAPKKLRVCELCGSNYKLGSRTTHKKFCGNCADSKTKIAGHAKNTRKRLAEKGFFGTLPEQISEYEAEVMLRGQELLDAYVVTMKQYGQQSNETLMTLRAPELNIDEHEATNEFTPFLKQMFLNLYIKMPRQDIFILEHLGISEQRYKKDLKEYSAFSDAVLECDRKHFKLLELISIHNAMSPKATSERIFHLKAGDPARYRESYKGDTFNMGQMNIVVSSNIRGLGIEKNAVAGGGKHKK